MERWLGKRLIGWLWVWLGASALVIVAMANYTPLDLMLADWMFDFSRGQFTYQHVFFFDMVMHSYAKYLLLGVWLVLVVFALLPTKMRPKWLSPAQQYRLRWVAALAIAHSSLVSWLKHQMPHACPWDITRYGGSLDWFPAFAAHTSHMGGHCFPAGHASSGLWLSALCLCWLPHHPRKALVVGLAGLAVGFMLGWCQQLRGAHFLSHTLTSVWLMCALLLCVLSFSSSRYLTGIYPNNDYPKRSYA